MVIGGDFGLRGPVFESQPVWPDARIKSSQFFTKRCPKRHQRSFLMWEERFFKLSKKWPNIWSNLLKNMSPSHIKSSPIWSHWSQHWIKNEWFFCCNIVLMFEKNENKWWRGRAMTHFTRKEIRKEDLK